MQNDESLLEFPCTIDVKAMGKPEDDFSGLVRTLISQHIAELADADVTEKPSSGGKYVAVTVRLRAESRDQLDAIYQSLSDEPRVLVAL